MRSQFSRELKNRTIKQERDLATLQRSSIKTQWDNAITVGPNVAHTKCMRALILCVLFFRSQHKNHHPNRHTFLNNNYFCIPTVSNFQRTLISAKVNMHLQLKRINYIRW